MKADMLATNDVPLGDKESESRKELDQTEKRNGRKSDFPLDNLSALDMVRVQGEDCRLCREDDKTQMAKKEPNITSKTKSAQQNKDSYIQPSMRNRK